MDVRGEFHISFESPGQRTPCTQWAGGWVEPRVVLDFAAERAAHYTEPSRLISKIIEHSKIKFSLRLKIPKFSNYTYFKLTAKESVVLNSS
jgi:hypothetical protein